MGDFLPVMLQLSLFSENDIHNVREAILEEGILQGSFVLFEQS